MDDRVVLIDAVLALAFRGEHCWGFGVRRCEIVADRLFVINFWHERRVIFGAGGRLSGHSSFNGEPAGDFAVEIPLPLGGRRLKQEGSDPEQIPRVER